MTRKPSPHDYLKRDPEDFDRSEIEAVLNEALGISFDLALQEDDFPSPDYLSKGCAFWWAATFLPWLQRALDAFQARAAIQTHLTLAEEIAHERAHVRAEETLAIQRAAEELSRDASFFACETGGLA